eukprot:TRINITY_DN4187_c0_g1_i1.p2 TRINITY_DN4187_c0_g1~~TRINITY_DN4187_c0_g1_i1.p2  ORF type:complete len:502 (-),score=173.11 TRINITY_DN4187_c0_g1_i1:82-1587(-)
MRPWHHGIPKENMVPLVTPFIKKTESREGALLITGAMIRHMEKIDPQVFQELSTCIKSKDDDLREASAWVMARIAQHQFKEISELENFLNLILEALNEKSPRVVSHLCWALHAIFDGCETNPEKVSPFTPILVQSLLKASEIHKTDENLELMACEALTTLVRKISRGCEGEIVALFNLSLDRWQATIRAKKESSKETSLFVKNWILLVSECLGNLGTKYLDPPAVNRVVKLILETSHDMTGQIERCALVTLVGTLGIIDGPPFASHLPSLWPLLSEGVQHGGTELKNATIATLKELQRALGRNMLKFADDTATLLLSLLLSPTVDRRLKPEALVCLAELALMMDLDFKKHLPSAAKALEQVLTILKWAQRYKSLGGHQIYDFASTLKDAIFKAYICFLRIIPPDFPLENAPGFRSDLINFLNTLDASKLDDQSSLSFLGLLSSCATLKDEKDVRYLLSHLHVMDTIRPFLQSPNCQVKQEAEHTYQEVALAMSESEAAMIT